jgi:hypothetical protein
MPPEAMTGETLAQDVEEGGAVAARYRYDGRAMDVYSLSLTLIQMWTCEPLYPGAGMVEVRFSAKSIRYCMLASLCAMVQG